MTGRSARCRPLRGPAQRLDHMELSMKTLFTAATLAAAFALVGCNNNKANDAAPGATSGCCGSCGDSCGGDAAPGAVSSLPAIRGASAHGRPHSRRSCAATASVVAIAMVVMGTRNLHAMTYPPRVPKLALPGNFTPHWPTRWPHADP